MARINSDTPLTTAGRIISKAFGARPDDDTLLYLNQSLFQRATARKIFVDDEVQPFAVYEDEHARIFGKAVTRQALNNGRNAIYRAWQNCVSRGVDYSEFVCANMLAMKPHLPLKLPGGRRLNFQPNMLVGMRATQRWAAHRDEVRRRYGNADFELVSRSSTWAWAMKCREYEADIGSVLATFAESADDAIRTPLSAAQYLALPADYIDRLWKATKSDTPTPADASPELAAMLWARSQAVIDQLRLRLSRQGLVDVIRVPFAGVVSPYGLYTAMQSAVPASHPAPPQPSTRGYDNEIAYSSSRLSQSLVAA